MITRRKPAPEAAYGLALLCALATVPASAQDSTPLAPLSIRAASAQPDASIRISAEQLARHPHQSLESQLLGRADLVPFRLGGSARLHPTAQGLSLRGLSPNSSSRTSVLLDGVPLNDPFAGWIHWHTIPDTWIRQMQIEPGAGGLAAGAIGGGVELFSQLPATDQPRLKASLGSHQAWQAQADSALGIGRSQLGLYGRQSGSHGVPLLEADQAGAIDIPAHRRNHHTRLQWHGPVSAQLGWRIEAHHSEQARGNGTPLTDNHHRASGVSTALMGTAADGRLGWESRFWLKDEQFASRFSAQAGDRSSENPALDQFAVPVRAIGMTSTARGESGAQAWRITADARQVDGETREHFRFLDGEFRRRRTAGSEEAVFGLYLENQWRPIGADWSILGGLRVDHWQLARARRLEVNREDGQVLRDETRPARHGQHWNPRLALLWEASPHWQWRIEAYRASRLPTLNERVRPFRIRNDITEANPDLRPERLRGAELASHYRQGTLQWQASIFWLQMENAIGNRSIADSDGGVIAPCGFVPAGGSCSQRDNLGRLDNHGLEFDVRWQATSGSFAAMTGLLSRPEIGASARSADLIGRQVAQQPRHALSIEAGLRAQQQIWTLAWQYQGARFEDDLNSRRLPASKRWNLGWQWQWGPSLQFFAGVDNLLDKHAPIAISNTGLVSVDSGRLWQAGLIYQARRRAE